MGCCCSVSSGGSGGVSKGREEGKLLEGGRGNTPTYDIPGGAVKSAGGSAGVGNRSDAPTFGAGYRLLDKIGKGSSSECYRCVDRTDGSPYAVKILNKRKLAMYNADLVPQLLREIKLLRQVQHPHIIRLFDVFQDADSIYVVMELMNGGELFDYVISRGALSERDASAILRQLLEAIVYLHQRGIVHRDLKPENLLLRAADGPPEIKLIDFGSSVQLSTNASATTMLGTLGYVAPEVLKGRTYTSAVDVWAVGVIAFVLLCGCFPFNQQSIRTVRRSHYKLEWPKWATGLSRGARNFVKMLLEYNPSKRASAAVALAHPWIASTTMAPDSLSLESPGRLRTLAMKRDAQRTADRIASAQRRQVTPNRRRVIVEGAGEEEMSPRASGEGVPHMMGKSAPAK